MSKRGWFFSILLHVGVALAAVLGLPDLFESDALDDEPIVVSVVTIAAEARTPVPAPEPAPEPEPRAAPEPPPPEEPAPVPEPVVEPAPAPEPEPRAAPEPPPPEELAPLPALVAAPVPVPEPVPVATPAPAPEPVVEPDPLPEPPPQLAALPPEREPASPVPAPDPAPAPVAEPEAEPSPAPPPLPPSAKPAVPFGTLLRSIAEDDAEAPAAPLPDADSSFKDFLEQVAQVDKEKKAAAPKQAMLGDDQQLSRNLSGAIKLEVEENWSVPAGVRDADRMVVTLRIRLDRDGAVRGVEVVEDDRPGDGNFRIMAESAQRAVLKASPFEFLTEHGDEYEQWRNITMMFKPPV